MKTYYAVCNSNGPISVAIEANHIEQAIGKFEAADKGEWIDNGACDAEGDLDIEVPVSGMDEDAFADAMRAAGYVPVRDIDIVANHQAGTAAHLDGGWMLWGRNHECVHSFCPVHNGYGCEEEDIITGDGIYEVHPGTADDLDSYSVVNSQTGAVRADGMTLQDACEYADELNAIASESPSIPPGSRVCGGEGDDYDEGTLDHYREDGMAIVRWDSGVVTPAPTSALRRL